MAQSEYLALPDVLLRELILPRLDSFDVLRLVLTCKGFREFQKRAGIPLRTKITDVLKGSWTSILWAKTWCDEFPWSPKLIPISARVSSLRVVQLLNQQFEIQRPLLGRIGYEAAQVVNSPVLLWALRNISDTADAHRMMKSFFALICLENLGSRGRLDILSVISSGNDSHGNISQKDRRLALELGKIVSDKSVYCYRNPIIPSWFNGMEPVLPILGEHFEHPWMLAVVKGAVENSQIETLTWLWQNSFEFHNVRRLYLWAGKSGDRDIISWVKEHSGASWNKVHVCKGLVMVTKNYATFRPVELIQSVLGPDLENLGNWHSFLSVFESAARYGRKDVLKWGFQNNLKLCGCLLRASVSKVDEGAKNIPGIYENKLSVLNWLVRRNSPFECLGSDGRLIEKPDIMRDMLFRSVENPSIILARRVREIGRAHNFEIFLSLEHYLKAASSDYIEVFEEIPPFVTLRDREEFWIKRVSLEACKNGSLRIIKWFAKKFHPEEMRQIYEYAEEFRQATIISFLKKTLQPLPLSLRLD